MKNKIYTHVYTSQGHYVPQWCTAVHERCIYVQRQCASAYNTAYIYILYISNNIVLPSYPRHEDTGPIRDLRPASKNFHEQKSAHANMTYLSFGSLL